MGSESLKLFKRRERVCNHSFLADAEAHACLFHVHHHFTQAHKAYYTCAPTDAVEYIGVHFNGSCFLHCFSSKSFISIHRSCYPLLITYGPAKTVAASVLSAGAGASLRHGAGTVCFYNPKQIMNYDKTDLSSLAL